MHADFPAPSAAKEISIVGPVGRLEAIVAMPKGFAAPLGVCVVGHPHPLFGGAMSNKVVYTLAASALKAGLIALRFNFRGVGRSQGLFDESRGETDDALAAIAWLRERAPGLPLVLAGFSFGAYVTLKAAATVHPVAQISVGIPFGRYVDGGAPPPHPGCPWLAVHSVDDEIVAYTDTIPVLKHYDPPPQIETFEGAGHFFHGRLTELQAVVQAFLGKQGFAAPVTA